MALTESTMGKYLGTGNRIVSSFHFTVPFEESD